MRSRGRMLWLCLLLVTPTTAGAQIAWDGPWLVPPRATESFGIFLMELEGGGIGAMGTWRAAGWNYGLRGGIGETGDELGAFGGIDFAGALHRSSDQLPLDIDWVAGAGVGVGNGGRVSVPLGLTGAHTFAADGALITPWATPRVFLDALFGRDVPEGEDESDVGLGVAFELGVDLRLTTPEAAFLRDVTIRVGASLGDREAVALGLVF